MLSLHSTKQPSSPKQQFLPNTNQPPYIKLIDTSFHHPDSPKNQPQLVTDWYMKPKFVHHKTSNNSSPTYIAQKSTQANTIMTPPSSDLIRQGNTPLGLPVIDQRTASINVYNNLKENRKGIFTTVPSSPQSIKSSQSPGILSGMSTPKRMIKIVMAPKDLPTPTNAGSKLANSNMSPRKRLALQEEKNKKRTIKDIVIRSGSLTSKAVKPIVVQPSSPKKGIPNRTDNSVERSKLLKYKEEEVVLPEEEAIEAALIHDRCEKAFKTKINMYSKFYTAYLFAPEQEYNSKGDLKVRIESFVSPKAKDGANPKELKQSRSLGDDYGCFSSYVNRVMNKDSSLENSPTINTEASPVKKMGKMKLDLSDSEENRANIAQRVFAQGIETIENDTKQLKTVQKLLQVKALNGEEEEFIHKVKEGKLNQVQAMVKSNPNLVNIKDGRNETPLHWAVKRKNVAIVEYLCKNEADIEAVDIVGRKPIDIARRFEEFQIIQILEIYREQQELRNKMKRRGTDSRY